MQEVEEEKIKTISKKIRFYSIHKFFQISKKKNKLETVRKDKCYQIASMRAEAAIATLKGYIQKQKINSSLEKRSQQLTSWLIS